MTKKEFQKELETRIAHRDIEGLKALLSTRRSCDRYGFLLTKEDFCEWLVSPASKEVRDEYPYKDLWHWDEYDEPIALAVKMLAEIDYEQKPKDSQGIYCSQESKDFIIGASVGEYGQLFEYIHGRFLDEKYKFATAYSQYQAMMKLHDAIFCAKERASGTEEIEM